MMTDTPCDAMARSLVVRYGSSMTALTTRDVARFWKKVDRSGECWLWTAGTNSCGYGAFHKNNTKLGAHRVAYQLLVGPIPEGLELDHLCRVRRCVNPGHLEPVTTRENILRGTNMAAIHHRKTHCVNGHEFSPENTKMYRGTWRVCITCKKANDKAKTARRKKARL